MSEDDNDIIANRRAKLDQVRGRRQAFPNDFRRSALAAALHDAYDEDSRDALAEGGHEVRVAGRIMLRRIMGKASFFTLQDVSGRIQCYLRREAVGEDVYEEFTELWDIGDVVGIAGVLFKTNKGELTVEASEARLLTKSLRPLPEKFHGLADQETRFRQRYLDLIMNESSRELFRTRSAIVQALRDFFVARDFLEVETPMMQTIPGGAAARPFVTHHNALDLDLYLRIAPELFLKRLVVGGYERVFEINRNFRNEGLSTRHNPEFTMLEFYQAYADYEDLMDLTEDLLRHVAQAVLGSTTFSSSGETIDLAPSIERVTLLGAIESVCGYTEPDLRDVDALRRIMNSLNLPAQADWGIGKLQLELFEARVEERLVKPTFVTAYPAEVSPLARRSDDDPDFTDRFELFIGGREIANGFSELNDPEDQARRFEEQVAKLSGGDHEAMRYDRDYVRALEYGLPPTAGEGIGVDRLVMLLTDSTSIREVLLFPHMRPRD